MDHVSAWKTPEGNRILLCQPYQLYDIESLLQTCKHFHLSVLVSASGYYGNGTIAIELWPESKDL